MNKYISISITLLLLISSCAFSQKIPKEAKMEDFFYIQKSTKEINEKWALFLPGTSGLTIFTDTQHYFNVAKTLNENGISVILVDYKKAYKAADREKKESTGEKIIWVLEEAIKWGKQNGIPESADINVVGWSLAGEGLAILANNKQRLQGHQINSISMFYPSNQDKIQVESDIPMLIQSGENDNITPADEIKKAYQKSTNVELIIYANSFHGFDVQSLVVEKKMKFPPIFGKKYTFKYNKTAAEESIVKLVEFIKNKRP